MDYGMGEENPLERVRYYTKKNPDEAISLDKKKVGNYPDVHVIYHYAP